MKVTMEVAKKGKSAGVVPCLKHVRSVVLIASTMLLSACSVLNIGNPEYGCSGLPDGVQCMSTRDVYTLTNDGNVPVPLTKGEEEKEAGGQEAAARQAQASNTGSGDSVVDNYVAPRLPDRPVPIRTPAQVMRIWVAPWEDTNGDLIVSGFVYTEIEPRRWVIGNGAPESEPVLRPLQTIRQETPRSEVRN